MKTFKSIEDVFIIGRGKGKIIEIDEKDLPELNEIVLIDDQKFRIRRIEHRYLRACFFVQEYYEELTVDYYISNYVSKKETLQKVIDCLFKKDTGGHTWRQINTVYLGNNAQVIIEAREPASRRIKIRFWDGNDYYHDVICYKPEGQSILPSLLTALDLYLESWSPEDIRIENPKWI